MRRWLICLMALGAIACAPVEAVPAATDAPVETALPAAEPAAPDAATCSARGGEMRPVCRRQLPMCILPYADAGKSCRDDADCEGRCIYRGDAPPGAANLTGKCQADNQPCGCTNFLSDGKSNIICVD
jgi:putative hemolysin